MNQISLGSISIPEKKYINFSIALLKIVKNQFLTKKDEEFINNTLSNLTFIEVDNEYEFKFDTNSTD